MQALLSRGGQAVATAGLLSPFEAERIIENLRDFEIDEIGTQAWLVQEEVLDKLNLQAHHSAATHAHEFVQDAMMSYDKLNTLVRDALLMEVFRECVVSAAMPALATQIDSVTSYLLVFHEANVANFLEILLFNPSALDNIEEELLLELVDWCYRQIHYLNTDASNDTKYADLSAEALMTQSAEETFSIKLKEVRLAVATCSLTILRYITDGITEVPISILTRLMTHHDFVMALAPLLDNPPWRRRTPHGIQQLDGTQWALQPVHEQHMLAKLDAQCRNKYRLDDYRKDALLRLRRFMNDLLLDQLPVLRDLQRTLDELMLHSIRPTDDQALIVEQVPGVRRSIMRNDMANVAGNLLARLKDSKNMDVVKQRMRSMMDHFDYMLDSMEATKEERDPSAAAAESQVRLVLYKKHHGTRVPSLEMSCTLDCSQEPQQVLLKGDKGVEVHGLRYVLDKSTIASNEAVPCNGRIVACFGSKSAQAILELPAPDTKSNSALSALPQALWVTIGLLAQDKMVFQLKVQQLKFPKQRDENGCWCIYAPVAGAITVLKEIRTKDREDRIAML